MMLKDRLRAARLNVGMTQAAAARAIGVVEPTYRNWESGRSAPQAGLLRGRVEKFLTKNGPGV